MALPPHLADLEGRLASRVEEALASFRRAFEERLRTATERLVADATSVAPPHLAGLLAEVESEAFDAAPRREGALGAAAELVAAARRLDRATTQADVLEMLVACGRAHADRLALLIVRDDQLVTFECAGFHPAPEKGHAAAFEGTLRERLFAARGCLTLTAEAAGDVAERLGWTAGGAAVVLPLVLRDQIAALLWADRAAAAPELAPLQLLAHLAAQRLELQALSERAFTPTLYEGTDAPGAPLPLWSAPVERAPAVAVEPESVEEAAEPALDASESFEVVAGERAAPIAEPEVEFEEAEFPRSTGEALAEPAEAVVDELWTGATEPAQEPAFEPARDTTEPARQAEGELAAASEPESWWAPARPAPAEIGAVPAEAGAMFEEVAPQAEPPAPELLEEEGARADAEPEAPPTLEMEAISVESEVEAEVIFEPEGGEVELAEETPAAESEPAEPSPSPALQFEEAAPGDVDVLRTMRLPILNFPLAGAERVPEETTASVRVEEVTPRGLGASTHEFPAPDVASAPPAVVEPPAGPDLAEDETVLTRRYPVMPAIPTPAPESLEPSASSSTASTAPFATLAASAPSLPYAPPTAVPPPAPFQPIAPPVEDPMDRTASRQRSTEVAPPPDLQGPGRAFLGARQARATVEPPTHEEARRLARLLISEIKLYNEEQVLEGRRNRDLYHRLKDDIDRSRQIYEERVDPAVRSGSDYFHQELVRSLAGGDPRALGI